ncbi:MAG: glutamate 5-kinase [Magnetococcales bacterium]|nr:glutamate 5-kinase [Magnetococcales bacterium]
MNEFSLTPAQAWHHARQAKRLVVKIGSNLLTHGGEYLQPEWIAERCGELAQLIQQGRQVVVVTSGAVAAGAIRLGLGRKPRSLREKQAAAAAGQGQLMRYYDEGMARFGLQAAQVLLTRDDVVHRQRYLNARDTLQTLLEHQIIPVINENDTVVVQELRFGDNDTLAALVAGLLDADLLILLSDVDGLFDANPRTHPQANHIPLVERITPEVEGLAGGVGSGVGSGGMITKIKAARKAARFGCPTILANGFLDQPILRLFQEGGPTGTLFLPEEDRIRSRKRWIANGLVATGSVTLDNGAVDALFAGKSLLAKGITHVEGQFDRGDAVYCLAPGGRRLAKGLVNYQVGHLRQIAGCHSRQFESILGFMGDEEVIHRDNLVILDQTTPHG